MVRRTDVWRRVAVSICLLAVGGCALGPKALEKSHGRYANSVRQVEEEQLLTQIVRLRYNESFLGLDITAIAAQYELSASAEARPFFEAPNPSGNGMFRTFRNILPAASVNGSDRPTISYSPIDDGSSVRRFLTPITFDTLIFLTQTSWPVSSIVRLWVERINGVPNAVSASGPRRDGLPDFARFAHVAELLQSIQDQELAAVRTNERFVEVGGPFAAEAVTSTAAVEAVKAGLEYRPRVDGKTWMLVRRERQLVIEVSPGAEDRPEMTELASLLNLVPGRKSYEIAMVGRGSPDPQRFALPPTNEVRLVPRSTAQVLFYLSNGVETPVEHVCNGTAAATKDSDGQVSDLREITHDLFQVKACRGHKPPAHAYVAIRYRDHWFYIDDRDHETKATFALILQLSRLDFARQSLGNSPAFTLPVGR